MRWSLILLFVLAPCFSSPFHRGASWVWSARELGCSVGFTQASYVCSEDSPTMLSAEVIDSTWIADRSTYRWTIRFADSASAYETRLLEDTAILEEDSSRGLANWIRGTVLFPIEPREKDPAAEASPTADSTSAWGEGWRAGITDSSGKLVLDQQELQWRDARMNNGFRPRSLLRWDSRLGWVAGLAGRIRWHLVRKDGEAVSEASAAESWGVGLPRAGTVLLWERKRDSSYYDPASQLPDATSDRASETTSTGTVRWTFLETLPDSLGWMRATVEEIRSQGGKDSTSTLSLRWDRHSGRSIPNPENGFCGDLISEFWGREYLPYVHGFREHADSLSFRQIYEHGIKSFLRTRRAGGVDSSSCWHGFQGHMGWYGSGSDRTTYRLLQVDDSVLREPSPVAVRIRLGAHSLHGDLRALARKFPASEVTLRDVRGGSRTLRLDQLGEYAAARTFGPKFWEVRLPDGSIHRGTLFE